MPRLVVLVLAVVWLPGVARADGEAEDARFMQQCMADSGGYDRGSSNSNTKLDEMVTAEVDDNVFIIPTLAINDVVYRGSLMCPLPIRRETCGVFSTICAGFAPESLPPQCGCATSINIEDCNTPHNAGGNGGSGGGRSSGC